MRYYQNSINFIKKRVREKFPDANPKQGQEDIISHLFWMIEEMRSFEDSAKAGRWIGWIFARAENIGLLTNEESRTLAKKDSEEGNV